MEQKDVNQMSLRTGQYWYVDGLNELAFGALCFILGIYFVFQANLPEGSWLYQILNLGFIVLIAGSALLASRLVNRFKKRLTYPRTGFVAYRPFNTFRRLLVAGIGLSVGILMIVIVSIAPKILAWMPLVTGLGLCLAWLFVAIRFNVIRFYLIAALACFSGLWIALSGLSDVMGLAVFYIVMAFGLLISGGPVLRAYLRANPLVQEANHGE